MEIIVIVDRDSDCCYQSSICHGRNKNTLIRYFLIIHPSVANHLSCVFKDLETGFIIYVKAIPKYIQVLF